MKRKLLIYWAVFLMLLSILLERFVDWMEFIVLRKIGRTSVLLWKKSWNVRERADQ